MQAQGLDDPGGLLFQLARHGFKGVGGKKLPGLLQFHHLIIAPGQLLSGQVGIFFRHRREDFLLLVAFKQGNDIVGGLIYHMH